MTRPSARLAGVLALATALALTGSVLLFDGGPDRSHGAIVLEWFTEHAVRAKSAALLGMAAMALLAAFAIVFREALWALVVDEAWTTLVVLQASVVFGVIAMISAGAIWSLADQATAGTADAAVAASMWSLSYTLFRFATWGLVIPMAFATPALYRHSTVGQSTAVAAVLAGTALVLPVARPIGLLGVAAWLALTGIALLLPLPVHRSALVPAAHG